MTNKFKWANDDSRLFTRREYLQNGEEIEDRVRVIADAAEKYCGIVGFADKFYDYMSRGWFSLSTPVWTNYGTKRGLPVSCFGSYIDDTMTSILYTVAEVGMLSKAGGGTSGYWGAVRHRGAPIMNGMNGASNGAVSFMKMFDTMTDVISQGSVRRGFFSPYLPITHPDFDEFVGMGGDGHEIQTLIHGVTVSDEFMNEMIGGNKEFRRRWAKVIQARSSSTGYPYIFFEDTINNNTVDVYKDKNMKIWASNMCTEIALPSSPDETFVCVLSSMNLIHWDEWKDTDAVETLTIFLDTVCEEFIQKVDKMGEDDKFFYKRAYTFAKNHRALGLGVLGWHSLLQSKMIDIESRDAAKLNVEIFKTIKKQAWEASKKMAEWYGEPELLKGYGRRNTTLTAIAPTKSSSFILGQASMGIEPIYSNYYIIDNSKTKTTYKSPYLKTVLEKYNKDTDSVWDSIRDADGSCQHLDFLSDDEKRVFKTLAEINPKTLINLAATRQPFVDQSQSLNLFVDPNMTGKEINNLYINAWELGVKTLYYQYSLNASQTLARNKIMQDGCTACEG